MRFYKIEVQAGGLLLEKRAGTPAYTAAQEGRLMYNTIDDGLYMGIAAGNDFYQVFDQMHDASPDTPGAFSLGDSGHWWANVHARDHWVWDNGAFHGNLEDCDEAEILQLTVPSGAGNWASIDLLIGNIFASDGTTRILENGSNGTDAWFRGDIRSDNNANCLNSGATPAAALFFGTASQANLANLANVATIAKYA